MRGYMNKILSPLEERIYHFIPVVEMCRQDIVMEHNVEVALMLSDEHMEILADKMSEYMVETCFWQALSYSLEVLLREELHLSEKAVTKLLERRGNNEQ